MKSWPSKILPLLFIMCASSAFATPRILSVGQSVSLPRYINPESTFENRSYHLHLGYYFRESVHIDLGFVFGLDGDQQIQLRFGPEFYLFQDVAWLPWMGAKYIYTINPQGNQGWMAQVGVEKDLSFLFRFENIVLRASTGFAQVYVSDAENRTFWEMLNVGIWFTF